MFCIWEICYNPLFMSVMLRSSYISHWPLTFCALTGFDPPQSRPWELTTARTTVHLVTLRMPRDQWLFLFRNRIITDVESKFGSQVSFSVPPWCTQAPLLLPSVDRRSHGRCDTGQLSMKECLTFLFVKRCLPLRLYSIIAQEADIPPHCTMLWLAASALIIICN